MDLKDFFSNMYVLFLLFMFISGIKGKCNSSFYTFDDQRGEGYVCIGTQKTKNPNMQSKKAEFFSFQKTNYSEITNASFSKFSKAILIDQDQPFTVNDNAFLKLSKLETLFLKGVEHNLEDAINFVGSVVPLKSFGITVALKDRSNVVMGILNDKMEDIYKKLGVGELYVAPKTELEKDVPHTGEKSKSIPNNKSSIILNAPLLNPKVSKRLENLFLMGNSISNIYTAAVKDMVNLKVLYLTGNEMDSVPSGVQDLIKKGTLAELHMDHNLVAIVKPDYFPKVCNLTFINLAHNNISRVLEDAFENCTLLETLVLKGNPKILCVPPSTFAFLRKGSKKLSLDLDETGIVTLRFTRMIRRDKLKLLSIKDTDLSCRCELKKVVEYYGSSVEATCLWGKDRHTATIDFWKSKKCREAPDRTNRFIFAGTECASATHSASVKSGNVSSDPDDYEWWHYDPTTNQGRLRAAVCLISTVLSTMLAVLFTL